MATADETTNNMRAILISPRVSLRAALRQALYQAGLGLNIAAEVADVQQALNLLAMPKPDLAFVDADIPGSEVFSLMQTLYSAGIAFVVLSDTERHAFHAVEIGAMGYLLVPVEPKKAVEAVRRVVERTSLQSAESLSTTEWLERRVCFRNHENIHFVALKDLVRIEAKGNCSSAYAVGNSGAICMAKNIKEFVNQFAEAPFMFQPHRSHLINLYYAKKYSRTEAAIIMRNHNGGAEVPVPLAEGKREAFFRKMAALGGMGGSWEEF